MGALFEELDWRPTPLGEISLRRRRDPVSGDQVYEVKLDDDFLMSSQWTAGEVELARLGLAAVAGAEDGLDVVVGGLGLGYTAQTVLDDPRVRSLAVVEGLAEVIGWHRDRLVPLGERLADDPRCALVHGDFFAMAAAPGGLDPDGSGRRFHAVLVDIDHSPKHLLDPGHAGFYEPDGLRRLAARLRPGGIMALWSNDPPDAAFTSVVEDVFGAAAAHVVEFPNPLQGGTAGNTVYVGGPVRGQGVSKAAFARQDRDL